jgi:hypothetical protein
VATAACRFPLHAHFHFPNGAGGCLYLDVESATPRVVGQPLLEPCLHDVWADTDRSHVWWPVKVCSLPMPLTPPQPAHATHPAAACIPAMLTLALIRIKIRIRIAATSSGLVLVYLVV